MSTGHSISSVSLASSPGPSFVDQAISQSFRENKIKQSCCRIYKILQQRIYEILLKDIYEIKFCLFKFS